MLRRSFGRRCDNVYHESIECASGASGFVYAYMVACMWLVWSQIGPVNAPTRSTYPGLMWIHANTGFPLRLMVKKVPQLCQGVATASQLPVKSQSGYVQIYRAMTYTSLYSIRYSALAVSCHSRHNLNSTGDSESGRN